MCIIKQGGASPEYMSDTAPLLATVNMPDKNRSGFLKSERIPNEKDHWAEADVQRISVDLTNSYVPCMCDKDLCCLIVIVT